MNTRPLLVTTALVVAAELVLSGLAWTQLQPGARVPIHWDINGTPNGYAAAWLALLIMPSTKASG